MKKLLFSILGAFMVSTMASAQYLNVKLDDGTYHSYKTSSKTEVSFGDKKGTDPTVSTQSVTVNGHTVAVKLADDTPASEVMLNIFVERDSVKIEAFSKVNHGLWCSMDDNGELSKIDVSNGFYTFTLSTISKDVVVTLGYINVSFDLNNSGIDAKFTAKPNDIKKVGYNAKITEPDRLFSDKYGFRGWYTDKECTKAWNFSTDKVTKSMTLYAKWKEDPTGNQISNHDFVKLGGYYWATKNVYMNDNKLTKYAGNENYGSYFTQENGYALYAAQGWLTIDSNYRWTLPSEAQWQALLKYCEWEWYTNYSGMNGMLVKGRDETYESGYSIFLPAAGHCLDESEGLQEQGYIGYYWSADYEMYLDFTCDGCQMRESPTYYGMSVRPVAE